MKPSIALKLHRQLVLNIIAKHHVKNPRVFGSVLYGLDEEGSDLDILVEPSPDTTLMDIGAIQYELKKLLGIPVDILTPNALPDKFRRTILAEAKPL